MWSKPVKKTIYTVNVDNYAPELTELTYPFIRRYAQKIGAEFYIISERKSPSMPPVYEKLQIYDLCQEHGNDWNIYIDSDALVSPDLFDVTVHLAKDTVLHYNMDQASIRWRYDHYFWRDGRNIGSGNWFTVGSDWCRDLWHPLEDMTLEEAVSRIYPINNEIQEGIAPSHLIDDYILSRNIAKYGHKFMTFLKLQEEIGDHGAYFFHQYTLTMEEKVQRTRQCIRDWKIVSYLPEDIAEKVMQTTSDQPENGVGTRILEGTIPFRVAL